MAKISNFSKLSNVKTVSSELLQYEPGEIRVITKLLKIRSLSTAVPSISAQAEAIRKLNSLQTNVSVLKEAKKRILSGNERKDNVETTRKYLKRAGVDLNDLEKKVIHISGTKGKGTTAVITESLLRSVPYKTGLFTSPHLTHVRERISINGEPLSLATFVSYFWDVYDLLYKQKEFEEDMPPYFKFLTVMALKVFISENVDVAIIEVGIGGELDCTNVFGKTPVVGITSIGLDHTSVLGDTVEKIAWQKAGIFKPGCRAFTIDGHKQSVFDVLLSRASEKQCSLEVVPSLSHYNWDSSQLTLPKKLNSSLALQLAKAWNVWNNNKCHGQYKQLEIDSREKEAITSCKIFGRCQILDLEETNTSLFLDGAHTVESLRVAKEWFLASAGSSKRLLIFNITGPRSAVTLLKELQNCGFSEAIFCTNCISETSEGFLDLIKERESLDSEYTKVKDNLQSWSTLYPDIPGSAVKTVEEALRQAESSKESKSVLITGSLHLVGSVLAFMSKRQQ